MTDPLRARRDDPDGASRLADELNRAGATDQVITIPLSLALPTSAAESIESYDGTGETISSQTYADLTTLTQEVTQDGYDELFAAIIATVNFTNAGTAGRNHIYARLTDGSDFSNPQFADVPALTADETQIVLPWCVKQTTDQTYSVNARLHSNATNLTVDSIDFQVIVLRRNLQPSSWREVAFISDDDSLIFRRATLAVSSSTPWTRNTSSYYRIKAGVAAEDSSQVDWIGDGYDGSKLGLANHGSVRLTGTADANIALPKGKLVVVNCERLNTPGDIRGASVQVVIGRKGS